ncbi:hypothetical protein V8E36_005906 [Tilletia maclaganii]
MAANVGDPAAAAAGGGGGRAPEPLLLDPFSPSPSRSSSPASSTRSSRSDDSISPSASASQVRARSPDRAAAAGDGARSAAAAATSAIGASHPGQPHPHSASISQSIQGLDTAMARAPVEPPAPVDALQPSPLHMLTLLGSQLLQHDQYRQHEDQIRNMGLSGIEELFNEEHDVALEIDAEEEQLAQSTYYPGDTLEHSRADLRLAAEPQLSASLTEDLRKQGEAAAGASVSLRTLPLALMQDSIANLASQGDGDEETPKGPLTPLQASQLFGPRGVRARAGGSASSPLAQQQGEPAADELKDQGPKRTLTFAKQELIKKEKTPTARDLLTSHLIQLFSLPPNVALADGSTRPLRILSLHTAHLFRSGTLLTGTLYLTNTHVLFYAYMRPRAPGAVLQMGTLGVARGKGWGWADEAQERLRAGAPEVQRQSSSGQTGSEPGSDSVATLQAQPMPRGSIGSGAAARIGAFLRKPSLISDGSAGGTATTPSPTDSTVFGTTPTVKPSLGTAAFTSAQTIGSTAAAGVIQQTAAAIGAAAFRRRAPRKCAHHFILTPRSLSWFASERDPYFPVGQLDLRWIRAVYEPIVDSTSSEVDRPGTADADRSKLAAEWYIEYVIPPGPKRRPTNGARRSKGDESKKPSKTDDDEQERRYTLLLRAPSAEDARVWCSTVRRAVLRAGGTDLQSTQQRASGTSGAAAAVSLDVRRDSVRVSIPLTRIVDVEGSVGASGAFSQAALLASASEGKQKGKERAASDLSATDEEGARVRLRPEEDTADGRTFVIRVLDASTRRQSSRSISVPKEESADVQELAVPLDEYCFVDVQRQHDLWRRLERALARIPPAALERNDIAGQDVDANRSTSDADEDEFGKTFTDQPVSFTYPPSIAEPIPSRLSLPRALSGPAKGLATGLALTRPVASGINAGASQLRNFVQSQSLGLMERVKEVWSVAPVDSDPASVGGAQGSIEAAGIGSPPGHPSSRSRSQSGSEGWVADDAGALEEGEEGVDAIEDEEADADADALADLADSMSFSIVDLATSTPGLDNGDDLDDVVGHQGSGSSARRRTNVEQYNIDLFNRTFVLPISLHSMSLWDQDIFGGAPTSPSGGSSSRSGTSSSLEQSTSGERLLHTFTTVSLYRVLPLAGRLFVSERFLCFRSARGIASRVNAGLGGLAQGAAGLAAAVSNLAAQPGTAGAVAAAAAAARPLLAATGFGPGAASLPTAGSGAGGAATGGGRTLMMLPLVDIIGVASNRAYRYGHWGMVVMIRGHEEIFFEFSSVNEQKLCISTIEHQIETLHRTGNAQRDVQPTIQDAAKSPGAERSDAFLLRDLGERLDWSMHSSMHSSFPPESLSASNERLDDDAPAQAARKLRRELGMTSPVTTPSSPRLTKATLSPGRESLPAGSSSSTRRRARSISAMSAPGLRSVSPTREERSRGGNGAGARTSTAARSGTGDVSTTGTDTTTSSDLLSIASKPRSSMHFTMLTVGSRGDVQPYIALAKRLLSEGHRVRIATHGEFKEWVEGHGIEFYEVGGDPAELMRICIENGTFTLSFLKEGMTKFRGWLEDLLVSSWAACQGTDIVIESPSAMAGIHIAEALQVPYFRAFTMPWTRTRTYPHAFAVPSGKAGGNYNYMTYVIFDQVFWRASAGQVNRWRRKTLGLRSTNLNELAQHKVPFLYNFSPSLVPKPLDWYDWIHVTGFWFLDGSDNTKTRKWEPPADLVAFIQRARERKRKVVYIGWGSIVLSNAAETHQIVVDAVRKAGVCAIWSKGWSDRLSEKKLSRPERGSGLSENGGESDDDDVSQWMYEVNSVPHDWLFPQLDAACHHGGAGTLGASLRAGIPTIVKPHFADQFFWGQQVETLGVGRCVRGELTRDKLAAALEAATRDERMVRRARELGERIQREDGVGEAVRVIYRQLDYAASLIKPGTGLDGRSGGKAFVPAPPAAASGSSKGPAALEPEEKADDGNLGSRKSRETVRDAPFVISARTSGTPSATAISDDPQQSEIGALAAATGDAADAAGEGAGDVESDSMSEAWSVVSGSEDDR